MKPFSFVVLALFLVTGCSRVKPTEGPLQITTPAGYAVKYQIAEGKDFYYISNKRTCHMALLFLPNVPEAKIPSRVDGYVKSFLACGVDHPDLKPESDVPVKGDIVGESYKGSYAEFTLHGGSKSVFFMISNGTGVWQGQFDGPEEGWGNAMEILKDMKKKG